MTVWGPLPPSETERERKGYNGVDSDPIDRNKMIRWIHNFVGTEPSFDSMRGNKRISNKRLWPRVINSSFPVFERLFQYLESKRSLSQGGSPSSAPSEPES